VKLYAARQPHGNAMVAPPPASEYYNLVAYFDHALPRFFVASLLLHLLLLILWPKTALRSPTQVPIQVELLPSAEEARTNKPIAIPKQAPTQPSKAPAIVAKKSSPILQERPIGPKETSAAKEIRREAPAAREPLEEEPAIAQRQLPTLKELLPPVTWLSGQRSNRSDGPIRLDTKNPQYITYFGSVKRAIEVVWQYPDLALKYGLQGKLLLEFSILGNGELATAKIIRSSGSTLLDEEALRAVRSAAPFTPIPPWIGKEKLDILASFEYHDNRLNYRFMP